MWKAGEDRSFSNLMSLITGLQLFWINLEVIKCWTLLSNQIILQHHFERPLEQVTGSFLLLLPEDRISFSLLMRTQNFFQNLPVFFQTMPVNKIFNEMKSNLICKKELRGTLHPVGHSELCSFFQQIYFRISWLMPGSELGTGDSAKNLLDKGVLDN